MGKATGLIALCLAAALTLSAGEAASGITRVQYYPGWLRNHSSNDDNVKTIRQLFPGAAVTVCAWDGDNPLFWQSRDHADEHGREVGRQLSQAAPSERAGIALIGHSLGARVVIRALAQLARDGKSIPCAIIAGAAINANGDEDEELALAAKGVSRQLIVLSNQHDPMLKYLYSTAGDGMNPPVGLNGWPPPPPANVTQYFVPDFITEKVVPDAALMKYEAVRKLCAHLAKFYLEYLLNPEPHDEVVVEQDLPNLEMKCLSWGWWWRTLDETAGGWRLEEHIVTGHCRILDPQNRRHAWGSAAEMRRSFKHLKDRLDGGPQSFPLPSGATGSRHP